MPVEIKELIIKATVSSTSQPCPEGLGQEDIDKLKKEITKEVTERVLRILQQKNER